ncbi:hypothetical protein [Paraburkholderia terrae]|uniref:Uncharacterized protein n=1 Tax=Paraburkholderia terrae TaxID=311230 RepID=A0ABM7TMF5_9BURK|nr:hypothetical protein [Paraburkholderia terrae]BCZ80308.1 hypothetical protein PTKU64_39830 [Paraburkholderia terrae]BDC41227.1 hypothetical protein PTKU15_45240 [Paraburkholderia terrae]
MKSAEERLADALAEIERLKEAAHNEAVRTARYPWENPQLVKETQKVGYNFRMDPVTYLKIKWIMENKGGIKSIQQFLEKAVSKHADQILEELHAK